MIVLWKSVAINGYLQKLCQCTIFKNYFLLFDRKKVANDSLKPLNPESNVFKFRCALRKAYTVEQCKDVFQQAGPQRTLKAKQLALLGNVAPLLSSFIDRCCEYLNMPQLPLFFRNI